MKISGISYYSNSLDNSSINLQNETKQPSFGKYNLSHNVSGVIEGVNRIKPQKELVETAQALHNDTTKLSDFVLPTVKDSLKGNPIHKLLNQDLNVNILYIVDKKETVDGYKQTGYDELISTKIDTRNVNIIYSIPELELLGKPSMFAQKVDIHSLDVSGTLPELLNREETTSSSLSNALNHIKENAKNNVFNAISEMLNAPNVAQQTTSRFQQWVKNIKNTIKKAEINKQQMNDIRDFTYVHYDVKPEIETLLQPLVNELAKFGREKFLYFSFKNTDVEDQVELEVSVPRQIAGPVVVHVPGDTIYSQVINPGLDFIDNVDRASEIKKVAMERLEENKKTQLTQNNNSNETKDTNRISKFFRSLLIWLVTYSSRHSDKNENISN